MKVEMRNKSYVLRAFCIFLGTLSVYCWFRLWVFKIDVESVTGKALFFHQNKKAFISHALSANLDNEGDLPIPSNLRKLGVRRIETRNGNLMYLILFDYVMEPSIEYFIFVPQANQCDFTSGFLKTKKVRTLIGLGPNKNHASGEWYYWWDS